MHRAGDVALSFTSSSAQERIRRTTLFDHPTAEIMDHGTCNVLYVDRRVGVDRVVRRQEDASGKGTGRLAPSCPEVSGEHPEVTANIQALLANFDQGKYPISAEQSLGHDASCAAHLN